jgi:hypothetical protein
MWVPLRGALRACMVSKQPSHLEVQAVGHALADDAVQRQLLLVTPLWHTHKHAHAPSCTLWPIE